MNPNGRCYRYLVLFLLCYISATQYLCIEMPSGLQGTIIKTFKISAKEYNILFSAYTWPDIFFSILGGILIDRFIGLRAGYIILTVVVIIGQGILTTGAFLDSYFIMVAGRFIFGVAIGSLKSISNVLLTLWFKNKEVTFAMSLTFCTCRVAASLGLVLPQYIYDFMLKVTDYFHLYDNYYQLAFTFLVSLLFLITSLFACMIVVFLDIKGAAALGRAPFKRSKFNSKDLKDFSPRFWMSIIGCAMFYAVLYGFVANGQLFFISKFGYSTKEANIADFLVFAAPIIITPIIGFLVETIGYNIMWGISGVVLAILSHSLFTIAEQQFILPFLLASLFSFSYSLFGTAIYVLPSFIVQHHQLTTAYSIYNLMYCIIFACSSLIIGTIIDHFGYLWLEVYFIFLLCTILVLLIIINSLDKFSRPDKKINKPGSWLKEQINKWKDERDGVRNARKTIDFYSGEFLLVYGGDNSST